MLNLFLKEQVTLASEYSLTNTLKKVYENQLVLGAAIMELTLRAEQQNASDLAGNVRGALDTIGENAGHIKQGSARLRVADQT